MKRTKYISRSNSDFPTLAEESWREFRRFLSKYQWAFDDPSHSPRKADITHAILNRGKPGCCTFFNEEGQKYKLRLLQDWAFDNAITNNRKIYYVSYGKSALLYFDVDLHYTWQTPEDGKKALELLTRAFPSLFWCDSTRGFNGYLKVDLQGANYDRVNRVFDRLEKALQLYLAQHKNLADFELKGKVGFLEDAAYTWKQYGKLPVHQNWNFAKLEEFKNKRSVNLNRVAFISSKIEAAIPKEVLEQHKAYKKSMGEEPITKPGQFIITPALETMLEDKYGKDWRSKVECYPDRDGCLWIEQEFYRPGQVPITEREWRALRKQRQEVKPELPSQELPAKAPTPPLKLNLKLVDLTQEPDSFKRQKEVLYRLCRYLKRVPTIEEALAFIKEQRLFSGTWEDNQHKRKARVRSILNFIARDFDAAKCAKGTVNVGKYDKWATSKFPHGLMGRSRSRMSEYGDVVQGHGVHISPSFIAAFMAVAEFALLIDMNEDKSLPHNRAKEIWESLFDKGLISVPFCNRKWAICREAMVRLGIVKITDRNYGPQKAMKWDLGQFFPFLGLWKGKKVVSELGGRRIRITTREHNTLLCKQSVGSALEAVGMPARPPP